MAVTDPLSAINTRVTPQSQQADPRQVPNAAGGYGFELGDDARIHRFLTLGTTGGTYYTGERELTKGNAVLVIRAAHNRGRWLTDRALEISEAGRAPRQQPAIFALAAVAGLGDDDARRYALEVLPRIARTGTALFTFARYVEQFRGWGRGLRAAVARWYLDGDVDKLAYQIVKYRQRDGWSHRDLLRLAHPQPAKDDVRRRALFDWAVRGMADVDTVEDGPLPELVHALQLAQLATDPKEWVGLIERYPALSWEMLPDRALTDSQIWRTLVRHGVPQTALIRQLPRLTRLGVLDDQATLELVTAQLADPERLRRARVHPINVLVAQRTYASGQSSAGSSAWTPNRKVVDALDAAFYAAYGAIEPSGKRILIALDVSGSMGAPISGMPLSCREAAAALALVTVATESRADVVGFTQGGGWTLGERDRQWGMPAGISELDITPRRRLDDVVWYTQGLPFGGTDCALPMLWARAAGRVYDAFVVITDNETWAGGIHPHQALAQYREHVNAAARLAVVGMTANDVSVADPADAGQLDVAGFDSAVPGMLADFVGGRI